MVPSDGSIRKAALSSWCLLQQWVHCLEVGVKGNQLGTLGFFSVEVEKDPFFLWGASDQSSKETWMICEGCSRWSLVVRMDHFNNPPKKKWIQHEAQSPLTVNQLDEWHLGSIKTRYQEGSWKYQNLAIHKDSETHFQGSMFFQLLSSFKIATEFLWWKKRIKDWSPSTKRLPRTCSHHLWLLQQHLCTNSSVVSLRHTHGGFWRGVFGSNLGPKTPGWILD